jgi:hypothetical protein
VQLAFAGYLGYVLTLPRRYVPARWLNVLPCLALAVIVVDLAALAPAPMWGHQAFMVVWTLALPLAMGWQWRRSHSPLLRALMQWFALGGLILLARLALIHALPVQDLETRAFSSAPASWRSRLTPSSCSWSARCWVGRRGLRRILLWVLASLLLVVCDLMLVLALSVQAETACSSACWWWVRPICLNGWIAQTLLGTAAATGAAHRCAVRRGTCSPSDPWPHCRLGTVSAAGVRAQSSVLAQQAGSHSRMQEAGGALWAPLAWTGRVWYWCMPMAAGACLARRTNALPTTAPWYQTMVEKAVPPRRRARASVNALRTTCTMTWGHVSCTWPMRRPGDWGRYAQDTLQEMRLITHGMAGEAVLTDLLADLRARTGRPHPCSRSATAMAERAAGPGRFA